MQIYFCQIFKFFISRIPMVIYLQKIKENENKNLIIIIHYLLTKNVHKVN